VLKNQVAFILLHLSTSFMMLITYFIVKMKNKTQLHYIFLFNLFNIIIWGISILLEAYFREFFGYNGLFFLDIAYIGICFVPVSLLLTGMIFSDAGTRLKAKDLKLFIVPAISLVILWTNDYHHLFIERYSPVSNEIVYGGYFNIHLVYSYICILIGLYFLLNFSIRNSGLFSKQAFVIFLGFMVPVLVNVLFTLNIITLSVFATPVAFSFLVICYFYATLRYDFLNVVPIALRTVVDRISDGFVVVDTKLNIVDYNKTFQDTFADFFNIEKRYNLIDALKSDIFAKIDLEKLVGYIDKVSTSRITITFESHLTSENFDKYFNIEITPMASYDNYIGTVILMKDITQSKKDLEVIKENQAILMEQERLASLGQLMGGIAHNLMTPIMSISGGIEAIKDLVNEYDESVGDKNITQDDHHEIAKEMLSWLEKLKPYCTYMSDIITTVKEQAVQLNTTSLDSFSLDELVKRIELLMAHELKKYHCVLNMDFKVGMNTLIRGDVNNLVQVFDNIIINAIHSYEGKSGNIDFTVKKIDNNIEFMLTDYGKGIRPDVSVRLFKEMITTKGKNGTGLGLYMSYANVKGRFGGNMWFETEEGKGTTFHISIPCIKD